MSLVNQILKDLAKSSQQSTKSEVVLSGLQSLTDGAFFTKMRPHYFLSAKILSILFLMAALTMLPIVFHKHHSFTRTANRDTTAYASLTKTEVKQSNEIISPVVTHPAILTTMTFQAQHGITSLRFLLTQSTLYRVASNNSLHTITITLENAHFSTGLPAINYAGSAFTHIQMTNENDGSVKIILSVHPGAELNHLELNQAGALPELQLELFYNDPAPIQSITIKEVEKKARALILEGQYAAALALLNRFTPPLKSFPDYYALLAVIYQHAGKTLDAENLYRQLVTHQSTQPKWWIGLGMVRESLGKKNSALEAYARAEKYKSSLSPKLQIYVENRLRVLTSLSTVR